MGSIYVHIPFCKKRCTYCNFYSTVNLYDINSYTDAVCLEATRRTAFMHTNSVDTLYFGGGTPSMLTSEQVNRIYDTLASNYNLSNLKEFTLECNPDDITSEFIKNLKTTKVNRISIGVQSLDDKILTFINRRHTASDAVKAVRMLQDAAYNNISIDLIYGIPNQTFESWQETVQKTIQLNAQHISAYNLSFEEGTKIYSHRGEAPDDETCLRMYEYLCGSLESNGFEHYEISNFAKPGCRSHHNSVYWNGGEYLGLGAGAHSFNSDVRLWNGDIKKKENLLYWQSEQEELTEQDKFNDLIITALRTSDGLYTNLIAPIYKTNFDRTTEKLKKEGLVKESEGKVSLTKKGIFVSNIVMREYIEV